MKAKFLALLHGLIQRLREIMIDPFPAHVKQRSRLLVDPSEIRVSIGPPVHLVSELLDVIDMINPGPPFIITDDQVLAMRRLRDAIREESA